MVIPLSTGFGLAILPFLLLMFRSKLLPLINVDKANPPSNRRVRYQLVLISKVWAHSGDLLEDHFGRSEKGRDPYPPAIEHRDHCHPGNCHVRELCGIGVRFISDMITSILRGRGTLVVGTHEDPSEVFVKTLMEDGPINLTTQI